MSEDDPRVTCTDRPGGQNKIAFPQRKEFCPNQPGHPHPARQTDDDHDVPDRWLEKGNDRQDQEKRGEAEHDVDKPHDQRIDLFRFEIKPIR